MSPTIIPANPQQADIVSSVLTEAADRPRLRAVYERFSFRFHDERDMGRFVAARYQLDVAQ